MITVVCWKWGEAYGWEHVTRLYNGVKRNLHTPFEFVCITDDVVGCAENVDDAVSTYPLPSAAGIRNGRRLWVFSETAASSWRNRILQLDLDMVITGDITPLITTDPFKVWKCAMSSRYRFGLNPSVMQINHATQAFGDIWSDFIANPDARLRLANRNGWPASDQAIISDTFTRPTGPMTADILCPTWTSADGIIALRDELRHQATTPDRYRHDPLPPNTRIVSFHGRFDPRQYTQLDWVREHWLGE